LYLEHTGYKNAGDAADELDEQILSWNDPWACVNHLTCKKNHSPVGILHTHPYEEGETPEVHYHTASVTMAVQSEMNKYISKVVHK
jgi:hypothetical protein